MLDNVSYDGELHIVHYNTKYQSVTEAIDKNDGLAVLGVFLTVQEEDEPQDAASVELDKICGKLAEIQSKGSI